MGIPTVLVSTGRDLTELVKPPRSVFVNFPMGNPFGRPEQPEEQRLILLDALELAVTAREPGVLVDLPYTWHEPFDEVVATSLLAMTQQS
jgi:hypothetical protein